MKIPVPCCTTQLTTVECIMKKIWKEWKLGQKLVKVVSLHEQCVANNISVSGCCQYFVSYSIVSKICQNQGFAFTK